MHWFTNPSKVGATVCRVHSFCLGALLPLFVVRGAVLVLGLVQALFVVGCLHGSPGFEARVPPDPRSDGPYFLVYEKWLREGQLNTRLQKHLDFQAVLLTSEFRAAAWTRWHSLRGAGDLPWASSAAVSGAEVPPADAGTLGAVVSLYTPEGAYLDLSPSGGLWSLSVVFSPGAGRPEVIVPVDGVVALSRKVVLEPLFPHVNQWGKDYLVTFAVPPGFGELLRSGVSGDAVVAVPPHLTLHARSALAHVAVTW